MFSWSKNGDRVAIVQLNAELRHAQLELLSAQCATDRLRLRFSADDIAHHAQRDVLSKAVASVTALHDYYSHIASLLPDPQSIARPSSPPLNEERITEAIECVAIYFRDQRERFRPLAAPLNGPLRGMMQPFFSSALLDQIRVIELGEERIPNPPFYAEAKEQGFTNLPDLAHMESVTFEDVAVFHEDIHDRSLFHALVHAAQFRLLGAERYAERYVRSFLKTRSHVSVPLEAHAFTLEAKYAEQSDKPFSVEENVRLWIHQGRY